MSCERCMALMRGLDVNDCVRIIEGATRIGDYEGSDG